MRVLQQKLEAIEDDSVQEVIFYIIKGLWSWCHNGIMTKQAVALEAGGAGATHCGELLAVKSYEQQRAGTSYEWWWAEWPAEASRIMLAGPLVEIYLWLQIFIVPWFIPTLKAWNKFILIDRHVLEYFRWSIYSWNLEACIWHLNSMYCIKLNWYCASVVFWQCFLSSRRVV